MKKVYITFSGRAYDATTSQIVQNAQRFGADEVRVYDDKWLLGHPYYELNRWLFEREPKFGFGWCAWKPLIFLEEFKRLEDGDLVLYTDADTYPISDLSPIFDLCRRDDITLFEEQGCLHNRFTKKDCLLVMNSDVPSRRDTVMGCGRFQIFKKGPYRVQQFLYEWLTYNLNPLCQFSDRPEFTWPSSLLGSEHETFARHSAEQSVLGLLALRYGIKLHRTPCQFGWPIDKEYCERQGITDEYPQLFHQQYCEGDRTDMSGSRFRNVGK